MNPESPRLRRRAVLALCGGTLTAGCLAGPPRPADGTSTASSTETAVSPTPSTSASASTSKTARPPEPSDFYLVNLHFETQRFSLTVRQRGRTLVDDEFAVPGSTGVVFEGVGEVGSECSVVATVSDRLEVSATWSVTACEGTEAPSGNSDGGVELEGETIEFRQNQCDVVTIGTRKIGYGEPDDYRV